MGWTEYGTHKATFGLVRDAKAFADRIAGGGWWVTNVIQEGRTVLFTDAVPEGTDTTPHQHFFDMLETVGYYGSAPTGRKARLDDVVAPASY